MTAGIRDELYRRENAVRLDMGSWTFHETAVAQRFWRRRYWSLRLWPSRLPAEENRAAIRSPPAATAPR